MNLMLTTNTKMTLYLSLGYTVMLEELHVDLVLLICTLSMVMNGLLQAYWELYLKLTSKTHARNLTFIALLRKEKMLLVLVAEHKKALQNNSVHHATVKNSTVLKCLKYQ